MSRLRAWIAIGLMLSLANAVRSAAPPTPALQAAINRAVPLLVKGAKGHIANRSCFGCHNQASPVLALTTARDRGFTVRKADLEEQLAHIAAFLGTNRANYLKGKGTGGQADTAGYALLTLEWGGWKADETTAAVVEYLLQYQKNADHWSTGARRPPSEASSFTTTYVSLRALRKWGTTKQKERIDKRIDKVRGWLQKAQASDTEDRVFRLLALHEAGVKGKPLQEAAQALLKTQRKDGGWSQLARKQAGRDDKGAQRARVLQGRAERDDKGAQGARVLHGRAERDDMSSDAYATGSALVALHKAGGVSISDQPYQRGIAFLLQTQKADGSWLVRSRSKPFQKYFESGFPHGKNQFISMAATGWATAALALACP